MSGLDAAAATETLRTALALLEVEVDEPSPGTFVLVLPGERKLKTTCVLGVGTHSLTVSAFVARRPDENHAAVYRWLLERNARMFAVAFAIDDVGDIWLVGRLPLSAATHGDVDGILGSVLDAADSAFNSILELGFASAIRREWAWRQSRGESTHNLRAFEHLAEEDH